MTTLRLILSVLLLCPSHVLSESQKSKEPPAQKRKYKLGDIKDEPSVFEENIREPSKWERFLTMTAAITLLWTGGAGEVNYRGSGSNVRIKTKSK